MQVGDVTLISVKYLPITSIPTKKSPSSFKNPLIIYKNYINELKKIKHLFKFITVSLYWYEYQNNKIILATSESSENDSLAHMVKKLGYEVFRRLPYKNF